MADPGFLTNWYGVIHRCYQRNSNLVLLQEQGSQNVTSSLVPGKNVMRLIHLGDLSDFIFVLYALPGEPLKPEERWRQGGWTSRVSRPEISSETTSAIFKYAGIPNTLS